MRRPRRFGRLLPGRHRFPDAEHPGPGTVGGGPAQTLKAAPRASSTPAGWPSRSTRPTSKDGTRIPYFQVARKDLAERRHEPDLALRLRRLRDPDAAVLPADRRRGLAEKGGVFVVANIRGGGEFGPGGTKPRSRRTGTRPTTTSSPSPRT